ncbi:MAG: glutathione S-transferase family protein [Alphaproteobacteria bacterium]|nr:glutathione S-transferase family protein [Alphaproteobacteria bacterium]
MATPYKLYYYPANANLAPHMCLEQIGVPYGLELVDRERNAQKSAEYLALNPNGRIPTLTYDDETGNQVVVWESAAICLHLAGRHPEAGLAPEPGSAGSARMLQWLMFLTNTIQPDMLTFYYTERHTDDPAAVASVKAKAEERMTAQYQILEDGLGDRPFLLGEQPYLVDYFAAMIGRFGRRIAYPPRAMPKLGPYLERVAALPAAQRTFASEGMEPPYF